MEEWNRGKEEQCRSIQKRQVHFLCLLHLLGIKYLLQVEQETVRHYNFYSGRRRGVIKWASFCFLFFSSSCCRFCILNADWFADINFPRAICDLCKHGLDRWTGGLESGLDSGLDFEMGF